MSSDASTPSTADDDGSGLHLSRRSVLRGAAVTAAAATWQLGSPSTASAALTRTQPWRALALTSTMGVRTHLQKASSTTYGDVGLVQQCMQELGMRHVREKLILPESADGYDNPWMAKNQVDGWHRLRDAIPGFSVCSVVGRVDDSEGTVKEFREYISQQLGGSQGVIKAVENGNEPNAYKATWNATDVNGWVPLVARRQEEMAREFRSDPAVADILLLGPSLSGGRGLRKYQALGDIRHLVDRGNTHLYAGNTETRVPSAQMSETITGVQVNCGAKPIWFTEIGFHNAMHGRDPQAPFPETLAGSLGVHVPFELLRRGIRRAYFYELLDQYPEPALNQAKAHFGLVRADGTRKPIFDGLRNMLQILADQPGRTQMEPLMLGFVDPPSSLQHMLLQKRDGRRYLALWRVDSPWSPSRGYTPHMDAYRVHVRFGARHRVRVFRPNDSVRAVRTIASTAAFSVGLDDKLVLLEIS